MMNLAILGLGTALPPHAIAQADAAAIARAFHAKTDKQERFIEDVYLSAGVAQRYSVVLERAAGPLEQRQAFFRPPSHAGDLGPATAARMQVYQEHAGPLAAQAAEQALERSQLPAEAITHLVTASCTGFAAPGFDLELVERLRLTPGVARTHVGFMGCHAALNALRVAHALAAGDSAARVLVACAELCTLHHQYGFSPDQVVANALFADGAASAVCQASEASTAWSLAASGSHIIPGTRGDMSWNIGDHGFTMTLSRQLPEIVREQLRPWLNQWLAMHDRELRDIRSWAFHPGGPKIISACEDALGLPAAAGAVSRRILERFGNMSSATVLFVLDELQRLRAPLPCVAIGFGPGLTIEAALFV
jgi:predicted naringenin-chalcone synthase